MYALGIHDIAELDQIPEPMWLAPRVDGFRTWHSSDGHRLGFTIYGQDSRVWGSVRAWGVVCKSNVLFLLLR